MAGDAGIAGETGPANRVNEKVIAIQKADGMDVGPSWWEENITRVVGNGATEQDMLDTFMAAYDWDFPRDSGCKRHPLSPPEPTQAA